MWIMEVLGDTTISKEEIIFDLVEGLSIICYLRTYDPDACKGFGYVEFTSRISEAKKFDSARAVLEEWNRQSTVRPLRDDGKPNKPLTAYTISPAEVL